MDGCEIGPESTLGQNVFVANGVKVGRGCKVQNNVSLYSGVELADGVFVGPSAVFTNVVNPRAEVNRRGDYAPTRVGRGVTIGANATIVCGVTLHKYAFVGAGAVVTRDVPAFGLVTGVPAVRTGWMSVAGYRLDFGGDGTARCPESGNYRLTDGRVERV